MRVGEGGWMAGPDRTAPAGREMRTISWRLLHGALHSCRRAGSWHWQRQALTLVGVETSCCRLVAVYSYYGEVGYGGDYGLRRPVGCCVCLCFPISRPASCVPYLLMSAACYSSRLQSAPRCRACAALRLIPTPVELQYHLRRFFLLAGLPPW